MKRFPCYVSFFVYGVTFFFFTGQRDLEWRWDGGGFLVACFLAFFFLSSTLFRPCVIIFSRFMATRSFYLIVQLFYFRRYLIHLLQFRASSIG